MYLSIWLDGRHSQQNRAQSQSNMLFMWALCYRATGISMQPHLAVRAVGWPEGGAREESLYRRYSPDNMVVFLSKARGD